MRNALRARARQLGNGVQADGFEPLSRKSPTSSGTACCSPVSWRRTAC